MRWMMFHMDIYPILTFTAMMLCAESVLELPLPELSPLVMQEYLIISVPTFYQCLELCVAFKLCRHLQFIESTSSCELNSDEHDRQSLWTTGYRYKSMKKTSIPQGIGGACRGHTCAIDEMCVQAGQAYFCVKHGYTTMKCPEQWGHIGDVCFTVSVEQKSWKEAKDFCESTGAELLTFGTKEEMADRTYVIYNRVLSSLARGAPPNGKIWTGLDYSQNLPRWMRIDPSTTNVSDPCIGLAYTKEYLETQGYTLESLEAVDCNEKNGFACQHRAPDNWP